MDIIALKKAQRAERLEKLKLRLIKMAYGLFLTYSLLGHIDVFSTPLKLLTYVAILILIVNFILQYNKSPDESFLIYAALMVVALIHSYYSGNYGFFKLMIFAGSMKTIGFKAIIRFDMKLRAILIVVVYALCTVGIAPDVVHSYEGISRRSMGFTNPNALGIAVFGLVCDIVYTYDFKVNFKITAIISAITIWMYAIARCRTASFSIAVLIIVAWLYKWLPQFFKSKFFKWICYLMPFVLSLLTFVATRSYMNYDSFGINVNDFTSGRIDSIVGYIKATTPTFWGQPIGETVHRTLDNTFAFVLYSLGILVSILFIVFYLRTVKINFKYNNIHLVIIMLAFMCYGLSEHLWINVDYNIFMLAFAYNPANEFGSVEAVEEQSQFDKGFERYNNYFKNSQKHNRYIKNKYKKNV